MNELNRNAAMVIAPPRLGKRGGAGLIFRNAERLAQW
jgi:hypothetical protein